MNTEQKKFSTKVISSVFKRPDAHGAISMPIYRNAAFEFASSEDIANAFQFKTDDHTYSRISNPTVENLENKMKAASGAKSVIALSSGMAAISNTFLTIAYAGSNIITSPHLFGNTFSLFKFTLAEFGVEVRFVNTDNIEEIEAAADENTCAFFCELITNPHMEVADIPTISSIMKAKGIPVIVDSTIIPWCGFDAQKAGADLEIVSTTKYVSGGATGIGGAILDYGTFDWSKNKKLSKMETVNPYDRFTTKLRKEIARNIGAYMAPDTASLQALGMETLQLRFERMSQSAYELALFLENQDKIVKVGYTKLESSPYKKISDKLIYGNPGAMLTFNLKSKSDCYQFMDNLKIIRRATNLFDNKTLIIHPESTIYGTFSPEMKDVMGIEDSLLRLSVGLEDTNDLKNDILEALSSI